HDQHLGAAARDEQLQRLAVAEVLFHVDLVGWDEEEVAGPDLGAVLEPVAPGEPGPATDHVDRALAVAVMVDARLEAGRCLDITRPECPRSDRLLRDAGLADHAAGLGRAAVALGRPDHLDA